MKFLAFLLMIGVFTYAGLTVTGSGIPSVRNIVDAITPLPTLDDAECWRSAEQCENTTRGVNV